MEKKKSKKGKKKTKKERKDVCEIFDIEKKGKEQTVVACGSVEEKPLSKNQIKEENKILKWILLTLGLLILLFLTGYFFVNSIRHFEYEGVKFDVVKEGNLIFYKTSFPVMHQGNIVPYNIYIRNDPRKLKEVPFEGELWVIENMVINSTEEFNCDGDGIIAIANFLQLYQNLLKMNVFNDKNATCDSDGRYTFVQIQSGNETGVVQFGPSCYYLNVNNCEILKSTERFMLETFVELNKDLKELK